MSTPSTENDYAPRLAAPIRPYPPDAPLVAVHEVAWEEAEVAISQVPALEDALANCNAYAQRLPDRIADFLLEYGASGDPTDPWQVGHNYAMREAARMVREKWFDLDGAVPTAPDDASEISDPPAGGAS